ncbi:MAG: 2-phosphosulfolactate phosphatase [Actinobacteria bacterium]|nr:2-phosphosulfolactate phosphatase [Actinomycetota bacterium]
MKVEVLLSNNFNLFSLDVLNIDFSNCVCVVIDVIRATSTIATLFGVGAEKIIITRTKRQALGLKKILGDYILCGEEQGLPPRGFDFGNSPLELSNLDLRGKKIILKTTNGTLSFFKSQGARATFSLSILNMKSTLDCVISYAEKNFCDILFLCSGKEGNIAYDDVYTAGLAVKYLLTQPIRNLELIDSAKLVLSVCLSEKSIEDALEKSSSAISLKKIGLGRDIEFCSKFNNYNITGKLKIEKFKWENISTGTEKVRDSQATQLLVLEPFSYSEQEPK